MLLILATRGQDQGAANGGLSLSKSATESESLCRQPSIIQFVDFLDPSFPLLFLPLPAFFQLFAYSVLHWGLQEKKEMGTQISSTVSHGQPRE